MLSASASAQKPVKLIESVLFQLKLRIEDCYEEFIVEKQLPDSPKESIIVIPKIVELEESYFSLDTYIVIVNNVTGNIKTKYYESVSTNGWQSDAVRMTSISIDTAPYWLQKKTRAFGIRVSFSGSSQVNPYSQEVLSLFVQQGNKLVPVLKNYEVDRYNGEWDGNCNGEFVDHHKVLLISKNKTNEYFDIQVKDKVTTTVNTKSKADGNCNEASSEKKEEAVLKFKNGKYQ